MNTPGYIDKRFDVHEGDDYIVILGPHDTTDNPAARVHGDTTEETLYLARVFAAGPDLLAACEEFVRKVDAGEARSSRSYAQMKAAIAKATS